MKRKKGRWGVKMITLILFPLVVYFGSKGIDALIFRPTGVSPDSAVVSSESSQSLPVTGSILLMSGSIDSWLLLNGKRAQQVPGSGEVLLQGLPLNTYTLQLAKGKRKSAVVSILVTAGDTFQVHLDLPPEVSQEVKPAKYQDLPITVERHYFNAKILVNGEWVANTPATIQLPYGKNLVRIEKDGLFHEEMISVPNTLQYIHIPSSYFKSI